MPWEFAASLQNKFVATNASEPGKSDIVFRVGVKIASVSQTFLLFCGSTVWSMRRNNNNHEPYFCGSYHEICGGRGTVFDSGFEKLALVTVALLLLALCWYLRTQLESAHRKLDRTLASFDGLRRYLYEIDPQFDDERHLLEHLADRTALDAGAGHMDLVQQKKKHSKRTLITSFNDG